MFSLSFRSSASPLALLLANASSASTAFFTCNGNTAVRSGLGAGRGLRSGLRARPAYLCALQLPRPARHGSSTCRRRACAHATFRGSSARGRGRKGGGALGPSLRPQGGAAGRWQRRAGRAEAPRALSGRAALGPGVAPGGGAHGTRGVLGQPGALLGSFASREHVCLARASS